MFLFQRVLPYHPAVAGYWYHMGRLAKTYKNKHKVISYNLIDITVRSIFLCPCDNRSGVIFCHNWLEIQII